VTLWILNKNKGTHRKSIGDEERNYREREEEVLFMDLRHIGIPFEKKFIQFSEQQIKDIALTYHTWQQRDTDYKDVPEYCYSATKDEIEKKDFSLVPSKYIEFINRDENIDFDTKMQSLQSELADLLKQEEENKADLLKVFKELGYEIRLEP
jgi:type I restriction enzyme M protein